MPNDVQGLDDFSGSLVFSVDTRTAGPQTLAIAARQAAIDAEKAERQEAGRLQLEARHGPQINSEPSASVFRAKHSSPPKVRFTRRQRRKNNHLPHSSHRNNGTGSPPVFSPRFSRATVEITNDMTSQELARLIQERYPARLHNVRGHSGVALLERLTVESYAEIVRSDQHSTGLSVILAASGEETKHIQVMSKLLDIINVYPKEGILQLLFRTNGKSGHSHREVVAPAKDKPKADLGLSNAQVQVISESVKRIAHGQSSYPQLVSDIHDFLEIDPGNYADVETAQGDLNNRISFLQKLGSLIDSSGNGRPIDLDTLQAEFEFYELYSEADKKLKAFVDGCLRNFTFQEGNAFQARLDMIDFLEKRSSYSKRLEEAKELLLNIVELKKNGVRGALSLFYDAYEAVNKGEPELTIGGHFTEARLDLSLVKNRKDIKLGCVGEFFGAGSYKNMNPQITGLDNITTLKGISVDGIGSRIGDGKQLFFEHKSSGHALGMHPDRVFDFVRFANIKDAIPVFMFNRDLAFFERNRGSELTKIFGMLAEIAARYPVDLGYTQPLIFDKDGNDITEALLKINA